MVKFIFSNSKSASVYCKISPIITDELEEIYNSLSNFNSDLTKSDLLDNSTKIKITLSLNKIKEKLSEIEKNLKSQTRSDLRLSKSSSSQIKNFDNIYTNPFNEIHYPFSKTFSHVEDIKNQMFINEIPVRIV